MTAAEQLTLESLGVDLAGLARRVADAQEQSGRDDGTCARLAGVSVDRFRSWKENRDKPGVARMPKLADAVASSVPALMFGVGVAAGDNSSGERQTDVARRAAQLLAELVPHCDAVARITADIAREHVPVPGGAELQRLLQTAGYTLECANAVAAGPLQSEAGR